MEAIVYWGYVRDNGLEAMVYWGGQENGSYYSALGFRV